MPCQLLYFLKHNVFKVLQFNKSQQSTTVSTMLSRQREVFDSLTNVWLDPQSSTRPLHSMNRVRIPWIRESLTEVGAIPAGVNNNPFSGLTMLDVGCGGGILTEPLGRLGGAVVGLDCNSSLVNLAKSHAQQNNSPNVEYVHSSIEEYAVNNKEKYDVVVSSETIEHVENKEFFVKSCVECLKPGGSIFFTTNSKSLISEFFLITLSENILGLLPKGTHEYELFIDIEDLKMLLKKEKCCTVSTDGMFYNPVTNNWEVISNPNVMNYRLHAIKNAAFSQIGPKGDRFGK